MQSKGNRTSKKGFPKGRVTQTTAHRKISARKGGERHIRRDNSVTGTNEEGGDPTQKGVTQAKGYRTNKRLAANLP